MRWKYLAEERLDALCKSVLQFCRRLDCELLFLQSLDSECAVDRVRCIGHWPSVAYSRIGSTVFAKFDTDHSMALRR